MTALSNCTLESKPCFFFPTVYTERSNPQEVGWDVDWQTLILKLHHILATSPHALAALEDLVTLRAVRKPKQPQPLPRQNIRKVWLE